MPNPKYANRNAILKYIFENQDKYVDEEPLTILKNIQIKLGFAKSTIHVILARMLDDEKLILKEEKEHFTKQKNKIPVNRYYINPDKITVVREIISKM